VHSIKLNYKPNEEAAKALEYCRERYGRSWKQTVCHMWTHGNTFPKYHNVLQEIRNCAGPTWLKRFSLDKHLESLAQAPVYCSVEISCNSDWFMGDGGAQRLAQLLIESAMNVRVYSDLLKIRPGFEHTIKDGNGNKCGVLRILREKPCITNS